MFKNRSIVGIPKFQSSIVVRAVFNKGIFYAICSSVTVSSRVIKENHLSNLRENLFLEYEMLSLGVVYLLS